MVEHKPWKGPNYENGINGQRIAIVGHSHYGDNDNDNFTLDTMKEVLSGEDSYNFFNQIRDYFGFQDHTHLWNRVVFFNYLPVSVGSDEKRHEEGTKDQLDRARDRFLRLLKMYRPQKVLVFSFNVWKEMPLSREQGTHQYGEIEGDGFWWCTYPADGQIVMAFRLHHPEGAPKEKQTQAVRKILAMPLQQ